MSRGEGSTGNIAKWPWRFTGLLVLPGFPFFAVIAKVIWSDRPWPHNTWGNAVHQAWQAWLDAFWKPR